MIREAALLVTLTALSVPIAAEAVAVPARAMPDFICMANAVHAILLLGPGPGTEHDAEMIATMRNFYHGRLTVLDEARDWNLDADWAAALNGAEISDRAIQLCAERFGRYSFPAHVK